MQANQVALGLWGFSFSDGAVSGMGVLLMVSASADNRNSITQVTGINYLIKQLKTSSIKQQV